MKVTTLEAAKGVHVFLVDDEKLEVLYQIKKGRVHKIYTFNEISLETINKHVRRIFELLTYENQQTRQPVIHSGR